MYREVETAAFVLIAPGALDHSSIIATPEACPEFLQCHATAAHSRASLVGVAATLPTSPLASLSEV
jgi:hypothetical protein